MPNRLLEGAAVCGGVVTGPVRVVINPRDAVDVQPGEILVVPRSHPEYALGVVQAAGLICEQGGIICHICTVALELGIPCVTEVEHATTVLATSMCVTLDGNRGLVYGHEVDAGREIERKFKLPALPDRRLLGAGVTVAQGYLPGEAVEMRVRKKGERCYLTVKGVGDIDRAEWETEMPRWVFDLLWPQTAARQVHKTRYSISHATDVLEIDEYHGGLTGLVTLECEFPTVAAAANFVLPDWASSAEEVSTDERFKNRRLAEWGLPK